MKNLKLFILSFLAFVPELLMAQTEPVSTENWLTSPGIIGTCILIAIVVFVAVAIFVVKFNDYLDSLKRKQLNKNRLSFEKEIISLETAEIDRILERRKKAHLYKLNG